MNKNRFRIGIDIDGVLIDTNHLTYLRFCEEEMGWDVDYKGYQETHSWYRALGQKSEAPMAEAFGLFLEKVEEAQKPIAGAHDALKRLSEIADLYLITARAGTLREVTENFLHQNLQDIRYHEVSMGNLDKKAGRITEFGVSYFIDDSHREISMILQNPHIKTTLIPFPAFHGSPDWSSVSDPRVHWLSIWEEARGGVPAEKQAEVHEKAWSEIADLITENHTHATHTQAD